MVNIDRTLYYEIFIIYIKIVNISTLYIYSQFLYNFLKYQSIISPNISKHNQTSESNNINNRYVYLHNPKNNNNNKIRLEVWHVGVWRNWFKPFSLSLEHKVSKNRGRFSVYTEFTGKPEEEEAAEDMVATIFIGFARFWLTGWNVWFSLVSSV